MLDARSVDAGGRRRRHDRRLIVGVVVVAALATAVVVQLTASRAMRTGPLVTDDDPSVDAGVGVPSLRLGQGFCYGSVVISNPSRHAATLESVRVSGGSGLTVGTARVRGNERSETDATAETCPTSAPVLRGYVVPAGAGTRENDAGVELMLPIRIDRPGRHRIDGVTVTYRVDGRSYRVQDVNDVVACTDDCDPGPSGR